MVLALPDNTDSDRGLRGEQLSTVRRPLLHCLIGLMHGTAQDAVWPGPGVFALLQNDEVLFAEYGGGTVALD